MSLIEAFRNFSASEDNSSPSPPASAATATPTPNPPSANLLYFPSSLRFGKVRALPGPDEVEYPPPDLAEKLVNAYFTQFHHTLPVLDSIAFKAKYKRLMEGRRAAEHSGTTPEPPTKSEAGFISVVFAVYAVAARFVDDERLKTDDREDHAEDSGGMGMVYYERYVPSARYTKPRVTLAFDSQSDDLVLHWRRSHTACTRSGFRPTFVLPHISKLLASSLASVRSSGADSSRSRVAPITKTPGHVAGEQGDASQGLVVCLRA